MLRLFSREGCDNLIGPILCETLEKRVDCDRNGKKQVGIAQVPNPLCTLHQRSPETPAKSPMLLLGLCDSDRLKAKLLQPRIHLLLIDNRICLLCIINSPPLPCSLLRLASRRNSALQQIVQPGL